MVKQNALLLALLAWTGQMVSTGLFAGQSFAWSQTVRQGEYFVGPDNRTSGPGQPIENLPFTFKNLKHSTTWCMFLIELDYPVELTGENELWLHVQDVSSDMPVRMQIRDAESGNVRYCNAVAQAYLKGGAKQIIRLRGPLFFEDVHPYGWHRKTLWPDKKRIQYVGMIFESRYIDAFEGSLTLTKIEYRPVNGAPQTFSLNTSRLQYHEFTPARRYRQSPLKQNEQKPFKSTASTNASPLSPTLDAIISGDSLTTSLGHGISDPDHQAEDPEPILNPRRDDPGSALFASGSGFKLELDPLSALGVSARGLFREETHRIDGLLINNARKKELRRRGLDSFDGPRSLVSTPIDVRNLSGAVIFDIPGQRDIPRFSFRYEDVQVNSESGIELDFRLRVHEMAALWTTPYFDDGKRFRLTIEPIYQYFRTTTVLNDGSIPRNLHRGLVNLVFHDEWEQREFFFQGIYGKADFSDGIGTTAKDTGFRTQWRQWYGKEKTAFSTIGFTFLEATIKSNTTATLDPTLPPGPNNEIKIRLPEDSSTQYELFGNLIIDLDEHGRWRWFNEVNYTRHNIDIFISVRDAGDGTRSDEASSVNHIFDFFRLKSRVTHEILPDFDLSLGLEHAVSDPHTFDSMAVEGRASLFNVGVFRAEFIAKRTWYYNIDDQLDTLSLEINFAR